MDIWHVSSQPPSHMLRIATLVAYVGMCIRLGGRSLCRYEAIPRPPSLCCPPAAAGFIAVNVASNAGWLGATNAGAGGRECCSGGVAVTAIELGALFLRSHCYMWLVGCGGCSHQPTPLSLPCRSAEVSAKFPVPLTPAGWAFSIWGLIFSLEGWGVVYQLREAGYDGDGFKVRHHSLTLGSSLHCTAGRACTAGCTGTGLALLTTVEVCEGEVRERLNTSRSC